MVQILDRVTKEINKKPFTGIVTTMFRSRKGQLLCVIEDDTGTMILVNADGVDKISRSEAKCKHEMGFQFIDLKDSVDFYFCNHMCGFSLNFNPDTYPDGVAFIERNLKQGRRILLSEPTYAGRKG